MGEAVQINTINDDRPALKTNLCIWLVYSSERFQMHMTNELSKCRNINIEAIPMVNFTADGIANRMTADIVFVEVGINWANKIISLQNEATEIQHSEASLIVFGNEDDSGALKIALRLGASDFLSDKAQIGELMPLLKGTADEKVANRNLGELILFINSKGGAGATTLALNTATELALGNEGNVLLVDLDLQFGVINDYLDSRPKYGIEDAIESLVDLDEVSLHALAAKHESGLHTLGFMSQTSNDNLKSARNFSKLLAVLRQHYDCVILDFSRGIEPYYASLVAPSTHIFIIAQQNLVSLKHTKKLYSNLQFVYGISKENIEVIVNRFEKKQVISLKDLKKALGDINTYLVPNEYKVAIESANLGKPFIISKKKSLLAKSVREISANLSSSSETTEKGWLSKLFS